MKHKHTIKNVLLIGLLIAFSSSLMAQSASHSLTFTSQTEVKFFLYINGKLQNSTSKGSITVNNLESKAYHVRIVMDDPFQVATTLTVKPSNKNQYSILFNPVKERIYVRNSKDISEEEGWYTDTPRSSVRHASTASDDGRSLLRKRDAEPSPRKSRKSSSADNDENAVGTTGSDIKRIRTAKLEE